MIDDQKNFSFVLPASEYISQGATAARAGKLNDAVDYYIEAIRRDPLNAQAFNLLGYAFFRKKQYIEAITYLETAIRIKPDEPWCHYNIALALWANGNRKQAVQEIKKVLAIDSKFKCIIKEDVQFKEFYDDQNFRKLIGND